MATHFVKQACTWLHFPEPELSLREMERLQRLYWPGNVRELQNVVERAVISPKADHCVLSFEAAEHLRQGLMGMIARSSTRKLSGGTGNDQICSVR